MKTTTFNIISSCLLMLGSLFLTSCERLDMSGMFYGSSPRSNERFAASQAYNKQHGFQEITTPADEYRIYFATDFHVDSTTLHTQQWVQAILQDNTCAAAIILGDMVNGKHKYPYIMDALAPLRKVSFPLFATAGNHDTYFEEWPEYLKYWGTSSYYFTVKTPHFIDLYICADTSDGTLGIDQLAWIRSILQASTKASYRHIIFYTHTHMFKPDGTQGHTSNFPMEETYEILSLLSDYHVDWYVSGHRHARDITTFKGVTYFVIDAIQESYPEEDAYYMVANIGEDLHATFISLAD